MVWVAAIALVLGVVGTFLDNFENVDFSTKPKLDFVKLALDSVGLAYRVFLPKVAEIPGTSNWFLTIANVLGSLVTFAAILSACLTVFKQQINKMRMTLLRNHSVVFGFDDTARAFANSLPNRRGSSVVVVNSDGDHDLTQQCQSAGYFHFFHQIEDMPDKLRSYALLRARNVIISVGSDETNLAILNHAAKESAISNRQSMEVIVNISNVKLLDSIESNDTPLALRESFRKITFFNAARQGAIDLMQRTPFVDQALYQNQKRVRLVVLGMSDLAIEAVLQFLRISPTIGLLKPRIDWIVDDIEMLIGKLHESNEVLGRMVLLSINKNTKNGPLNWAVSFGVHQLSPSCFVPETDMLTNLDSVSKDKITAVLIAWGSQTDNVAVALTLRNRSKRLGKWNAPVYVWSKEKTALDAYFCRYDGGIARKCLPYLQDLSTSETLNNILEPFGRAELSCNIKTISDGREKLAKRIHDAYLTKRRREKRSEPFDREESMLVWSELPETYRQSNRRAADHFLVKLISADLQVVDPAQPPRLSYEKLNSGNLLEKLSKIEHDAWRIDRELDGWRWSAKHDKQKKLHPDLIAYSKLPETIKDYDREQVKFLAEV